VGYHEPPCAGCSLFPIPCSLFPIPYSLLLRCLHGITLPGLTMVLSRAKEEGAGAKERRTNGEENSGTPLPPTLKPRLSRAAYQGKCNKRNSLIDRPCVLIGKQKPRKTADFLSKKQASFASLREKRPRLEPY